MTKIKAKDIEWNELKENDYLGRFMQYTIRIEKEDWRYWTVAIYTKEDIVFSCTKKTLKGSIRQSVRELNKIVKTVDK